MSRTFDVADVVAGTALPVMQNMSGLIGGMDVVLRAVSSVTSAFITSKKAIFHIYDTVGL